MLHIFYLFLALSVSGALIASQKSYLTLQELIQVVFDEKIQHG